MLFTKNYFKIGAFLLLIVLLLSGCSGRRAGEAKSPPGQVLPKESRLSDQVSPNSELPVNFVCIPGPPAASKLPF